MTAGKIVVARGAIYARCFCVSLILKFMNRDDLAGILVVQKMQGFTVRKVCRKRVERKSLPIVL